MASQLDQFLLFGDSITQDSFNQQRGFGFSAALQHAYIRRLDVVNRGFSGYNTEQALKVLPLVIPSPAIARIRFLIVFFGANDAALPQQRNNQHIPLSQYKENLEKILTHPLVTAHMPMIILVAPAPVDEHALLLNDQSKGFTTVSRMAARTKSYADAACAVGQKLNIPVVNLWKSFMSRTGFHTEEWMEGDSFPGSKDIPPNASLAELLYDGLHFGKAGYEIWFQEVMQLIPRFWPDQTPETIPRVLPNWDDAQAWESLNSRIRVQR